MALEGLDCFTAICRIHVEQLYLSRGMEINWRLVNPSLPRKTAAHCTRLQSEKMLPKSVWDMLGVYPPLPHCFYHVFCSSCCQRAAKVQHFQTTGHQFLKQRNTILSIKDRKTVA